MEREDVLREFVEYRENELKEVVLSIMPNLEGFHSTPAFWLPVTPDAAHTKRSMARRPVDLRPHYPQNAPLERETVQKSNPNTRNNNSHSR